MIVSLILEVPYLHATAKSDFYLLILISILNGSSNHPTQKRGSPKLGSTFPLQFLEIFCFFYYSKVVNNVAS